MLIAVGTSRTSVRWRNTEYTWEELTRKLSEPVRTAESCAEYNKASKAERDKIKDVGGFVGGPLAGGVRNRTTSKERTLITLDADNVDLTAEDFWELVQLMVDCTCCVYSTHSHGTEKTRLRLILPLSRVVTAEEYVPLARKVADMVGMDYFDDTTYQPSRLMYWPSCSSDAQFFFRSQDSEILDPDTILAQYPDWKDASYWPESSRQVAKVQGQIGKKQADPTGKSGPIGVFCRAYTVEEAIEHFLPGIYEACEIPGRYTYTGGSTAGGLVVYDGGLFAYSHHATDPAGGQLCNAFDLVRIHLFGEQDEDVLPGTPMVKHPSYRAMRELIQKDEKTHNLMIAEQMQEAQEDFADWMEQLKISDKGGFLPVAENFQLILRNDPKLQGLLAREEFSDTKMALGALPWDPDTRIRPWTDADDAGLRWYFESKYGIYHIGKSTDAVEIIMEENKYHEVRDYFNSLQWDGVERLDTLLVDYLGASDNLYTREATRKSFVAVVARIMREDPIKFDQMLTMIGPQGCGKSLILKWLAGKWFSDSLRDLASKDAMEGLRGAMIVEIAELAASRKTDIETTKNFLSKSVDSYRPAYGRHVKQYRRQCIFFGTTNDRECFRDTTGNRRYWPVEVAVESPRKDLIADLNEEVRGQIWAEAVEQYKAAGIERLMILSAEAEAVARGEQKRFETSDENLGVILAFLNTPLPGDWYKRTVQERRNYVRGGDFGNVEPENPIYRDKVCVIEIWRELYGEDRPIPPSTGRSFRELLRASGGWKEYTGGNGKLWFGQDYGPQKALIRIAGKFPEPQNGGCL